MSLELPAAVNGLPYWRIMGCGMCAAKRRNAKQCCRDRSRDELEAWTQRLRVESSDVDVVDTVFSLEGPRYAVYQLLARRNEGDVGLLER